MHVLAIIKHQIQSQSFVTFEYLLFLDTAYTKSILMFFTLGNMVHIILYIFLNIRIAYEG